MNNIDTNSSYSEQNEINKNFSNGDYNSILSNSENDKSNGASYINDFYNGENNGNNLNNYEVKKHRNLIDYLNINDDSYKKQQIEKKINLMLIGLKQLPKNIKDEIIFLSVYYLKKFQNKKLSSIVPIIAYKTIKKYNIKTVTLKDLRTELNFSYKTYFKNEKLFNEVDANINQRNSMGYFIYNNNINKIIFPKKERYSELVIKAIMKYIEIIRKKIENQPNIIKIKKNKLINDKFILDSKKSNYKLIETLFSKISKNENNANELYSSPIMIELNNCLAQCKSLIYNNKEEFLTETNISNQTINLKEEDEIKPYNENDFNNYFVNKIDSDSLGLGMLKYFIDKNTNISLSYKNMKELFKCNIYEIKKSILFIKEYIN